VIDRDGASRVASSLAAAALMGLAASTQVQRLQPAPRDLVPLPEGYDPTVVRSQPHMRPGQRKPRRRYYVCPCGMRSRLSWRFAAHRCSPAFNPFD
jgi:hypothetical protein